MQLSEPTMLLLHQVVLLHPVGGELIGGHSRKSRAVQTLDAEQQHNSSYTRQHGAWVLLRPQSAREG